jgi:hypothetical protein
MESKNRKYLFFDRIIFYNNNNNNNNNKIKSISKLSTNYLKSVKGEHTQNSLSLGR